jgi:hypothetical protein
MWRAIDNGKEAGRGSHAPSPMQLDGGLYLLFDNEEIAGMSSLFVRQDALVRSLDEAIRAGEAFMNRPIAEKYAIEGGVIDVHGNVLTPSRPIAKQSV